MWWHACITLMKELTISIFLTHPRWTFSSVFCMSDCVKIVQIRSFFLSVFPCIQSQYRKIQTRNSSVFGHFSRSVFYRHLNIILIYFYWLLLLGSVLRFPAVLSRVLWKPVSWLLSQFNCLVATWSGICVWGISEQITNSFISFLFFCLPVLYFYVAPSRVFLLFWVLVILSIFVIDDIY